MTGAINRLRMDQDPASGVFWAGLNKSAFDVKDYNIFEHFIKSNEQLNEFIN